MKAAGRSTSLTKSQVTPIVSATSVLGEERKFLFTEQDFERIRKLIYERAGISLSPHKRDMVYSRVRSFQAYLELLEQGEPAEIEAFTNSLTTNLTSFFREAHHFPLLQEHLRPRMEKRAITIWCSASSTGEEPYSIAMTVAELFGRIPDNVKIVASDLDTNVLEKARDGVYALDRVSKIPEDLLRKYFMQGSGTQEGFARVRPELKAMLTFRQINLLDLIWPMRGPFDVIFCRNVMIYFDKPTQHNILRKFIPLLAEDGLLFAGHSESFHHAADLFKLRSKTVYEIAAGAKRLAFRGMGR